MYVCWGSRSFQATNISSHRSVVCDLTNQRGGPCVNQPTTPTKPTTALIGSSNQRLRYDREPVSSPTFTGVPNAYPKKIVALKVVSMITLE